MSYVPTTFIWIRIGWFPILFPVLLFWLLAFVVWVAIIPITVAISIVTGSPRKTGTVLKFGWALYLIICAIRGFELEIGNEKRTVQVRLV